MKFKEYIELRNKNSSLNSLSNKEVCLLNIDRSKSGWISNYYDLELSQIDIIALCRLVLSNLSIKAVVKKNIRNILLNITSEFDPQFLYLMKNDIGLFKIGISLNPDKRASVLSTASGLKVSVISYWKVKSISKEVERYIHECYTQERQIGEWFKFSYEIKPVDIENRLPCDYIRIY